MSMAEVLHAENVVVLHPFTEEQAIDDLRALGRNRLSAAALGRRWQWNRKRAGNALKRWAKQELIARRRGIIVPLDGARSPAAVTVTRPVPSEGTRPRPVLVASVPNPPPQEGKESAGPVPAPVTTAHKWLGALAILLGCASSAVGLGWSIMSLARGGQDSAAGWLLVAVCVVIELMAITLPSFGTALWVLRARAFALVMWTGYAAAMAMVIFNGIGFAGMQIGDAVAGRAGIVRSAGGLREELDARLAEKAQLKFIPVDAAQIETASDQRDAACDRGLKPCEKLRLEVAALGKQRAINDRTAALDGEIRILRDKLATAPAVGAADPQVESTMEVIAWATAGSLTPSKRAVEVPRLLGLVLIPSVMGGLLLAAGMLLWQGRRHTDQHSSAFIRT
jgi:hypothetical protein